MEKQRDISDKAIPSAPEASCSPAQYKKSKDYLSHQIELQF